MRNNSHFSLAAHWIHEWLHVSGFRHSGQQVDRNDVPYKIGKFVIDIARENAQLTREPLSMIDKIGQEYIDSLHDHFGCVDKGL